MPIASEATHPAVASRWSPLWAAILVWIGAFAVMIGLLLSGHQPNRSYHVYEIAGRHWLKSLPLYETATIEHFQYFPQAAMLAAPFAWLGWPAGGIAWRAVSWTLYSLGIFRLAGRLAPTRPYACFFLATCLAVGPGIGGLGNGQANLAMSGLMLNAAADLIAQRWWRAAIVLTLGLALKPLMLVMLLLVLALYRPMRSRLPLALAIMFLAPLAVKGPAYAIDQYSACLVKLRLSARPAGLYEDVRGMLTSMGVVLPYSIYTVLRLLAALSVLALCARVRARFSEPNVGVLVAAFASSYLMLFNPRTQSTSYAMTASIAALLAATYALERNKRAALMMAAIVVAWTVNYRAVPLIEHWFKPLICVGFGALLVRLVLSPANGWLPGRDPIAGAEWPR